MFYEPLALAQLDDVSGGVVKYSANYQAVTCRLLEPVYFPEWTRVRWLAFLALEGFETSRLGTTVGREGGESSHQPSRSRVRGRRDRRNETGMIFAMRERMPLLLADGLSGPLRICGFLCRFCAKPLCRPHPRGRGLRAMP